MFLSHFWNIWAPAESMTLGEFQTLDIRETWKVRHYHWTIITIYIYYIDCIPARCVGRCPRRWTLLPGDVTGDWDSPTQLLVVWTPGPLSLQSVSHCEGLTFILIVSSEKSVQNIIILLQLNPSRKKSIHSCGLFLSQVAGSVSDYTLSGVKNHAGELICRIMWRRGLLYHSDDVTTI